ncbi:MAG: carbamoyltransferase C-terminal domain-containing protein [archaeon]
MNIIAINHVHNANITMLYEGKYYNFQLERYLNIKNADMILNSNGKVFLDNFKINLLSYIKEINKIWEIPNDFDICIHEPIISNNSKKIINIIKDVINAKQYISQNHHHSHAANVFYQSPYDKALIFSYDGQGNDGIYNIYIGNKDLKQVTLIKKINECSSLGLLYKEIGYSLKDIYKKKALNFYPITLTIAGKLMGLAGYGNVRGEWLEGFNKFYHSGSIEFIRKITGYNLYNQSSFWQQHNSKNNDNIWQLEGQDAYDLAATNQYVFEETFLKYAKPYIEKYSDLPICLAGGCSLNVLLNERLRKMYGNKIFIAPNTNDSGIALGQLLLTHPPDNSINITYTGLPILDIDNLSDYIKEYNAKKVGYKELSKLLKDGKIIGVCQGNSEVGPRALGNRSIICDPSYKNMKDKLNKIKHREWYRPFAPVVRLDDVNKYFEFDYESEFMSFAPLVREEYREQLSSITHVDNTARVQTVTKKQHKFFYDLLTEFDGVLLNTSFNIRGNPILTRIKDALYALDNTTLDYVYIEGYLFESNN